jgi:hypothetical protein
MMFDEKTGLFTGPQVKKAVGDGLTQCPGESNRKWFHGVEPEQSGSEEGIKVSERPDESGSSRNVEQHAPVPETAQKRPGRGRKVKRI